MQAPVLEQVRVLALVLELVQVQVLPKPLQVL